jgi:hypothetical protein
MMRKAWGALSRSQQWRYRSQGIGPREHTSLRRRESAYTRMSSATRDKLRRQGITRTDYVRARGATGRPGSERFTTSSRALGNLRGQYPRSDWPNMGQLTPDQQRRLAAASPDELRRILRGQGDDRAIAEHLWYRLRGRRAA